MKKDYGIKIKPRQPTPAAPLQLEGEAGLRILQHATRRVMQRHKKVIKALADR